MNTIYPPLRCDAAEINERLHAAESQSYPERRDTRTGHPDGVAELREIAVDIRLATEGGDLKVVASARHPSGPSASSDPHSSETAARAQALKRLAASLEAEAASV